MITPAAELGMDHLVTCFLHNLAAYNPETGDYLARSSGRSKIGRPARYILSNFKHVGNAVIIRAYSEQEAIDKANKHLEGDK